MSTSTAKTDDSDAAASKTYTCRDVEVAFNKGKGLSLGIAMSTLLKQGLSIDAHMEERKQQCDKVFQLCHDYQLHSPNLDGSVLEILQKVQQVLDLDSKFLVEHRNRDVSGIEELQKDVAEIRKVLEEQIKEGY